MSRVQTNRQLWAMPAALGLISLVGLVAALVADGFGDAVSWLALTIPVVVCGYYWRRSAGPRPARR